MNAGARAASGDLFLFVHADTIVPPAFDVTLRSAFQDPVVLMTTFRFGINRALLRGKEPFGMATMEWVTNYRTLTIHLPYGDQASASAFLLGRPPRLCWRCWSIAGWAREGGRDKRWKGVMTAGTTVLYNFVYQRVIVNCRSDNYGNRVRVRDTCTSTP